MKHEHETFELQPRLVGELIEVRPLTTDDWESLFAVASDPLIWEQHPARDRYQENVFREFFREALETGSAFAVIDRKNGQIIGSSRYFAFDPQQSVIEIGVDVSGARLLGRRIQPGLEAANAGSCL